MTDILVFVEALVVTTGVVCLTTALLDMGMNGARQAKWAPCGLFIAGSCLIILLVMG